MPRPTQTWKSRERQIARDFGAQRQRLSGSSGRADESTSDSTHKRLYIEAKHRKDGHAAGNLYREVAAKAKKEEKIPVVALSEGGRKGYLLVVHSSDLLELARLRREQLDRELEAALGESP